jgi:regulator of replication initiation timing
LVPAKDVFAMTTQQNAIATKRNKLQLELADLRKRMPAHSVKPEFIRQLEALEEQLAELEEEQDGA